MADRRPFIVPLVILTFIFLSPDPARGPASGPLNAHSRFRHAIEDEKRSLDVLQNSTWGGPIGNGGSNASAALNLTGLDPERGYAWDGLGLVQDRARKQVQYVFGDRAGSVLDLGLGDASALGGLDGAPPLYENVTGRVQGKWVRSKLEDERLSPHINLTEYTPETPFGPGRAPRHFGRNVTGDEGDVQIHFHERQRAGKEGWSSNLGVGNVTDMEIELSLSGGSTLNEHDLRMHGVYFPAAGQALLTTTSDKFAGIFALPHLALSEPMFDVSKSLLNQTIAKKIEQHIARRVENINPWSSNVDGTPSSPYSHPQCELVVYLQQLPPLEAPSPAASRVLPFLERELRFPTGAFLPDPPGLRFSMVAFSPDCGYVLESKGPPDYPPQKGEHLEGLKTEVLVNATRRHVLFFISALALQLALQIRQMREASTPSTRSRISYYTIGMLMLGDGFTWIMSLLLSFFVSELAVLFVGVAFLAFINMMFFGMTFFRDVWLVQAPEREAAEREEWEQERQRQERLQEVLDRIRNERRARDITEAATGESNATPNEENITTAPTQPSATPEGPPRRGHTEVDNTTTTDTTAAETTTSPPSQTPQPDPPAGPPADNTPVFMPSDQDSLAPIGITAATLPPNPPPPSNNFASIYSRFYLLLLGTLLLTLNALAWPPALRTPFLTCITLIYTSFWLPQLLRNSIRNCRRALSWEYVLGQSALRLLPFAYVWAWDGNVAAAERDWASLAAVAVWLWLQVLALASQALLGPRWCVPRRWVAEAYDYHPVLREDEEDGRLLPVGFSQAAGAESTPASPVAERRGSVVSGKEAGSRKSGEAKERGSGKRVFDCAICMQDLEVPVVESGGEESGGAGLGAATGGLLARRAYMVTPCRHIFHSACLEGWMKFRLQCPVCREGLPPL